MGNIIKVDEALIAEIRPELAWTYRIIPKEFSSEQLSFYTDSNDLISDKQELRLLLNKDVELVGVEKESLQHSLIEYYQNPLNKQLESQNLCDFLISEAIAQKATDIHLDPNHRGTRLRFRIDGKMQNAELFELRKYKALVNQIKVRAGLDISEKRRPQDGRFTYVESEIKCDIRVATLPAFYGEKIVMRVLKKDPTLLDLNQLGFDSNQLQYIKDSINASQGLILISGPTGSGKTTSLYALLKYLNNGSNNILSIEDPIEYDIEGINQVQVKSQIGFGFNEAIRTFLRHDPDIIMIGEIRDTETAQLAIRAALTGHLVISTIHTNSALETITRLEEMGIPKYLISSCLKLSISQRLVRKYCNQCKVNSENTLENEKHLTSMVMGCEKCHFTGFKGRIAVYEVLKTDKEIIESGKAQNLKTLKDQCLELVKNGKTSMEELMPILLNYS